jgi:hypothetical protein
MAADTWHRTGRRGGEIGGSEAVLGGALRPRGGLENIGRFLRRPGKIPAGIEAMKL